MFATFWTRELTKEERANILIEKYNNDDKIVASKLCKLCNLEKNECYDYNFLMNNFDKLLQSEGIPTRELSCSFTMRSNDWCCGCPYNCVSYSILTHLIAQVCNMTVGDLVYNGLDCHVYENHMDAVNEQLARDPFKYNLPVLSLNKEITNIDDFKFEDIKILNYESYPPIKYPLNVG